MFNSNVIILFYYSFIVIIPLHIVGGISGCVDWTWWALPCRRKLWRTHVPVGTDHTAPSTHHNLPCDYKTHRKYFKTARSRAIKHFSQIQIIRYYFNVLPDFGNLSCKKAIQRKLGFPRYLLQFVSLWFRKSSFRMNRYIPHFTVQIGKNSNDVTTYCLRYLFMCSIASGILFCAFNNATCLFWTSCKKSRNILLGIQGIMLIKYMKITENTNWKHTYSISFIVF